MCDIDLGSDQGPRYKAFGKFKLFAAEIQCMIFKQYFPDPQLIQFKFKIEEEQNHNEGRIDVELTCNLPTNPTMLPLLQACTISQNEVFDTLKRLKLFDEVENSEYKVFYHFLKHHFSTGNTSFSVCMRPKKDTLVLESPQLISLYRYGGYITMNNITHFALADVDPRRWERTLGTPLASETKVASIQAHLFQLYICPALEKI
ncbi:87d5761b-fe9c-4a84-83da-227de47ce75b [Sclerotinia trifoliorum]|uniref:87d5761b-fe9c-4a84-83da-227de47ce75b n=1 Tax=Sclerotinia trifoliorum TaxID=28548 RepID=A0A8H2VL92_9HELO|nr:87d5761b-fe9c-4a84-83da-227de47ce75b [Sclerotinia trifoliorum]